ncbi:hypothetical protein SARC_05076 [Sphaeroforma arctica JP610]|uniref:Chitin-binding type-4 domain-containing protein n=1 Tax=Sphaeroforma arctica JP610 TaxID=667725 RepID=A0A0L0G1G1_9EUKA|nr:hypothetical protein SARC_05076 [Sphaeroforma arctica JP610]KNC82636.1 hypothetical protein SARC_05076 [Sphaeroforma arctica JP610]|eukprot:XP_014156538.1 hypothetical protein SARC_05076 [Sphaeroforma arctica JP610]
MTFVYKLLVICRSIASLVDAHAYLVDPPSGQQLQSKAGVEYCPHCYNGGGTGTVQGLTPAGEWPFGSWPLAYGEYKERDATAVRHGLCGDAANGASLYEPGDARNVGRTTRKTYTAGKFVEFTVGVSTHHRGHYEFRLCELQEGYEPPIKFEKKNSEFEYLQST